MDIEGGRRQSFGQKEINWDKLDKTKFYVVGAGIFTGVTVALYPISVVKTRLQVASNDALERNAFSVIRGLLKTDGIPGLYREPTQAAIANGVAGMMASFCSQAVFVPIDVVSQRLMVQGYSGHATYNGGLDVVRKTVGSWYSDGKAPSEGKIVLVQAAGGIFAAATASCITTPLDTIKTRLQVIGHEKKPTARQVVRNLIANDGWTGLYRGLGPRFFSMSAWGTSMILAYEYLKRLCAIDE
ncbi:UNVERIFIED_CONTAM: Solute carrier family 25 member 44 [Sesamum radiatum]|uniref:Solute carrier family 25 member 44 n=1 Tax=Sesamum radiatum TaxID=300843 RepID=A0AAW2P6D6_SESRA